MKRYGLLILLAIALWAGASPWGAQSNAATTTDAILAGSFSGASSGASASGTPASDGSPPAPGTASAAAPVTVNVAVWGQFAEEGGPQPNLLEALTRFNHENIQVNLLIVPGTPDEYTEKVLVMLATLGDDAPDLFIVEPTHANSVYSKDVALDLSPFLEGDPDFASEVIFRDEYRGKIVGIPGAVDVSPLSYLSEALDAAGLTDPNLLYESGTWDHETFALYATKLTRRDGDGTLAQIGYLGTGDDVINSWPFIRSFGGRVMSDDGMTVTVNSPETLAAYEWMLDQVIRDAFVIAEFEAQGTLDRRGTGEVIFGQGSPTQYHLGLFPFLPEYVPYPSGPAGRNTMAGYQPWIIHAGSKKIEAAWEVLKFIIAEQAAYQMVRLGFIPNQRSLVRDHITLQMSYGQARTSVEAVWNETMATFTLRPRYPKPEIAGILSKMTVDILGGRIEAGLALAETSRQIAAILAEN